MFRWHSPEHLTLGDERVTRGRLPDKSARSGTSESASILLTARAMACPGVLPELARPMGHRR